MRFYLTLFKLVLVTSISAQNLVPNPSFESITACPTDFFQIYKSPPWFSPDCGDYFPDHGYAVLFNACHPTYAGVPTNSVCTQHAHKGVSYAGIEVVSANFSEYRQYLETMLTAPLESGKKYYFSMYFNLCKRFPGLLELCYTADSTGVAFTTTRIDKNPDCRKLPMKPDIHSTLPPIIPGPEWHNLDGCYVAKGGERFITIGNFGGEAISNCGLVDTLSHFIFVDDISLIPEVSKTIDTTLCPDGSWEVDVTGLREEYETMPGWTYLWSDGDTSTKRSFNSAENVTLTVSQKDCFHDVYDFKVKFDVNCSCQLFAPSAFTPNGDGLNDIFRPQIKCKTLEVLNYRLSLYNRWGQKVFYSTELMKGWDGKYKGTAQGTDVFVWMMQYDLKGGSTMEHKTASGTVVAIK